MDVLDAIETVLARAGEPLRIQEITRRMLETRPWHTEGKTPLATVGAALAIDIKNRGGTSRFQRTKRGSFALRAWGFPEYLTRLETVRPVGAKVQQPNSPRPSLLTMKDAAEVVLERYAHNRPMHYRVITQQALDLGLLATSSPNAASNLLMEVLKDIRRQTGRGLPSRFTKPGKGLIGLSHWL